MTTIHFVNRETRTLDRRVISTLLYATELPNLLERFDIYYLCLYIFIFSKLVKNIYAVQRLELLLASCSYRLRYKFLLNLLFHIWSLFKIRL